MTAMFSGPRIKIARARKHFAELEADIAAYMSSPPAKSTAQIVPLPDGRHEVRFTFEIVTPAPDHLGAIAGDILHNLRASLDLCACDLVRVAEGPDANVDRVYFPFCEHDSELDAAIKRREFNRAGDQAVDLLRQIKPYKGGNIPLRALHDLDIQDKHLALIPTPMSIASPILSRWDDDGTPNLTIVGDPEAPSEAVFTFPPNSALAGSKIVPTFGELINLTAGIVDAFARLSGN